MSDKTAKGVYSAFVMHLFPFYNRLLAEVREATILSRILYKKMTT